MKKIRVSSDGHAIRFPGMTGDQVAATAESARFFAAGDAWDEQVARFKLLGEEMTMNQALEMLNASAALLNEYTRRDARSQADVAMAKGTRDAFGLLLLFTCWVIAYLLVRK